MNNTELIELAKKKADDDNARKAEPYYIRTIAWLHYLGLLRHNQVVSI